MQTCQPLCRLRLLLYLPLVQTYWKLAEWIPVEVGKVGRRVDDVDVREFASARPPDFSHRRFPVSCVVDLQYRNLVAHKSPDVALYT